MKKNKRKIVKRPFDLACSYDDRVCICGNDEFYECGVTNDGECIYECTKCGKILYGMD